MGFWHTGYMEFHEPTSEWSGPRPAPPPPEFRCHDCDQVFRSPDDLAVHRFDGHITTRPVLTLHDRECGRSRLSVISPTAPDDWAFRNARRIFINGDRVDESNAGSVLSSADFGVVSVILEGERSEQEFEFSFSIANGEDLAGVDERLLELIRSRSLSINSIEDFLDRTQRYETARRYRDGLANYFYGVLARERSSDSGLLGERGTMPAYAARFDEAVAELGQFDRPAAEAICGLVAFHYNQFDLALRKTRSARVARASRRLATLLAASTPDDRHEEVIAGSSLDYVLSDTETEQVLSWCCIPLDGSGASSVRDIESALSGLEPSDQTKLRVIAAEHYLSVDERDDGLRHVAALRHSSLTETWASWYRGRLTEEAS